MPTTKKAPTVATAEALKTVNLTPKYYHKPAILRKRPVALRRCRL